MFRKNTLKADTGEPHSAEKVETFCFGMLVKKLAYAPFRTRNLGLKGKHFTTRPRTPELCQLRAETRELSRGKTAPALSHNTCLLP